MVQGIKPDILLDEAIDWLLGLQDPQSEPALSQQFKMWLEQSDAHAEAWQKAQQVWALMGHTEPVYENLWLDQNTVLHDDLFKPSQIRKAHKSPKMSGRRKVQYSALSVAAVVILFFAAPVLMLRFEADYRTANAQTETILLADGSTLTLAADSAVAVNISETIRHVRLLRGEAYFDVIKDASRPFLVFAGEAEVSVLGTVFDVKLTETGTAVSLERGVVEVRDRLHHEQEPERLLPGERVVFENGSDRFSRSTISIDDIAGWRKGYFFVEDVTVRSVIEELQRYHPAWIALADRSLGEERVTGLYNLNEPDRALRALVQPYGGTVSSVSPYLRVINRNN
ncbi:transmembrane sensor [Paenochrobactrum gallinarii]|uniref:Transmembrane sensor n=1 Tax=Paenochrobactrum gallinarii TaxID=643673 RepID=A0A841LSB1_9HYPH|nr:FecR family protein [Paenochrobactrum gallinarii]MBB6261075.1 transmembrane sensor [Paenochrobactrum gallinarii]